MKIQAALIAFFFALFAPSLSAKAEEGAVHNEHTSPLSLPAHEVEKDSVTTLPNLSLEKGWPSPVADDEWFKFFLAEILEFRWNEGGNNEARWDVFGWYGGDYNRLWIKSEGNASTGKTAGEGDLQVLYGRMISRYFDFQAGLRYEQLWDGEGPERSRSFGSIGVQGLAPYYFDIEPTLFISQDGDISGRFTGTYDILLTQRLILQPRIEGIAAVQENEKFGVGSGINNLEAGLRVRYEFRREFAPYIGINYGKRFGGTADLARHEGEETQEWSLVSGVRFWF